LFDKKTYITLSGEELLKLANATQGSIIKHLVNKQNLNTFKNLVSETQSEKLIRNENIVQSAACDLSLVKTETGLKNVENNISF